MKKITTVGFLFAILLAVALGVHHLAFAQSGSYSPAWVPPTWSNALPIANLNHDSQWTDPGQHSALCGAPRSHRPDRKLSARRRDHHLQECLFFFNPRHQSTHLLFLPPAPGRLDNHSPYGAVHIP